MRHGKETSEKPRVLYEIGQQQATSTTESGSSSGGGGGGKKQHIKRPLNAFMIWSKEQRRTMMSDYPKMHNAEISRQLGLRWKLLSEDEKHKYRIEASALKDQHREAYPDYKFRPQKRNRKRRQSNTSTAAASTTATAAATTNATTTKHKRKNNSSGGGGNSNEFTHRVEVISSEAEQRVVGEHIYVIHNTAAAAPRLTHPSPPVANAETAGKQFYLVPIRPKQQQQQPPQAKTVVITTTNAPAHHHKHVLTSPTPPPDCDDDVDDDVMGDDGGGGGDEEEVMPGGVTPPSSPMTDQDDEGCGGEALIELPQAGRLHQQLQHKLQNLPMMKKLEAPLMVAVVKEEPAEALVEPSSEQPCHQPATNLFTEEFLPLDCLFPELTPRDDDVIKCESKKKMSAEWMYINLEAFVDESCSLLRYFENPNQPIVRKKKMKENEDLNLSTDSGLE